MKLYWYNLRSKVHENQKLICKLGPIEQVFATKSKVSLVNGNVYNTMNENEVNYSETLNIADQIYLH